MFPYTDHNPLESSSSISLFKKQLYHDQNPISFFDQHQLPLNSDQICPTKMKGKAADLPMMSNSHPRRGVVPRKRTGKKDRHSKIRTAQGIRDRRMRLSLQVARKFFDLQDMLGYDKASKTIEWLFCKSNKAIKDLTTTTTTDGKTESSFISECVVSGIEENSSNMVINTKPKIKKARANARESREKARARARCRTREKMMIKLGCSFDQDLGQLYAAAADYWPSAAEDVGTIEKLLLGNSSNCSAPPSNSFMGNWDLFHIYSDSGACRSSICNVLLVLTTVKKMKMFLIWKG